MMHLVLMAVSDTSNRLIRTWIRYVLDPVTLSNLAAISGIEGYGSVLVAHG